MRLIASLKLGRLNVMSIMKTLQTGDRPTTIYMDAAIQQLRREGYPVLDSDVEKLSPLQCGHINMQGRYSFTVPESVSKGELRTFNEEI